MWGEPGGGGRGMGFAGRQSARPGGRSGTSAGVAGTSRVRSSAGARQPLAEPAQRGGELVACRRRSLDGGGLRLWERRDEVLVALGREGQATLVLREQQWLVEAGADLPHRLVGPRPQLPQ